MSDIKSLVQQWLSNETINTSRVTESQYQEANAVGDFLGNDTSDKNASGVDIFKDPRNLPTAIATIMTHTQNKANFHPATQSNEDVAKNYNAYINGLDGTPFFHLTENRKTKQSFKSKNYNVLIEQIVSLYDGVSENDKIKIKDGVEKLAKSVFSQSSSEQWDNLFSQSTIDYSDPHRAKIFVYYTTLHMKHQSGKSEVNEQDYTVNKACYIVLNDLISAYADNLAKLIKNDIDDWMKDSSTPADKNVKLCFK